MSRMTDLFGKSRKFVIDALERYRDSLRVDWHKHALGLILFFAIAMGGTALFSRAYEHRDVGSDSVFSRFGGDPWLLQRGAKGGGGDPGGPPARSIRYLWQGWTPADSMRFYTMSQGSDLMPYDFFLALRKTGTHEIFRSDTNMDGYRYLTQKATVSNPDALPVGFVEDTYKGKNYVGFTCAACHTTQLNYKGVGMRIDGGGAMSDMDTFMHDLAPSVCDAHNKPDVHERFVREVIALPHSDYSNQKQVDADLVQSCQTLTLYNEMNHSNLAYGHARLDAFGRIYNRVMEYILTDKELEDQVAALTDHQVMTDVISPATAHNVDYTEKKKIESHEDRSAFVDELWKKILEAKTSRDALDQIFIVPNAPVSYPFLWDIPQHDFVQWNGIAVNAGLGPVGRNAGEVIGVFATLNFHQKEGFSLSSLISGQGLKSHVSFESSVRVHNLQLIESQLESLQSPEWPTKILGEFDEAQVKQGEQLFTVHCVRCHERIQRDDPQRRVVAFLSDVKSDVKTDPQMVQNAINSKGHSGILKNLYVSAGPGELLIEDKSPAAALLTKTTLSVVATPEDRNFVTRGYDWAYDLISGFFSNKIKPSLKQGSYTPDTSAAPYQSLSAYKGRPLNGIWATAPYLHNGSVPTLYDLLLPSAQRPPSFYVGSREFDNVRVGIVSKGNYGFLFKTDAPGNLNTGHEYGTNLSDPERWALVEYLKTL